MLGYSTWTQGWFDTRNIQNYKLEVGNNEDEKPTNRELNLVCMDIRSEYTSQLSAQSLFSAAREELELHQAVKTGGRQHLAGSSFTLLAHSCPPGAAAQALWVAAAFLSLQFLQLPLPGQSSFLFSPKLLLFCTTCNLRTLKKQCYQ